MVVKIGFAQRQRNLKRMGYTPVVTGSMRNRLRPRGIEAPRGAYDGSARKCRDTPPPVFFVSAYSKGVTREVSVSAESKGLICPKIVQNARFHGSAESKGVTGATWRVCSR